MASFEPEVFVDPLHKKPIPTGAELRDDVLIPAFRQQKKEALAALARHAKTVTRKLDDGGLADLLESSELPAQARFYNVEENWNRQLTENATPVVEVYWEKSGQITMTEVGFAPEAFRVTQPGIQQAIAKQAFSFSAAANRVTQNRLDSVIPDIKREIADGLRFGDTGREMRKRVEAVFGEATGYRADRIARTEASRAHHAAHVEAAKQSRVVVGKKWLISADSCPICVAIAAENEGRLVELEQSFATVGNHPDYSVVEWPPAHPNCVLPGTKVFAPGVRRFFSATYNGPIVSIATRSGKLRVTENHLVMTTNGFAHAKSLRKGDLVISAKGRNVSIEDEMDSFCSWTEFREDKVLASVDSMHGDGARIDGEIEIKSGIFNASRRRHCEQKRAHSILAALRSEADRFSIRDESAFFSSRSPAGDGALDEQIKKSIFKSIHGVVKKNQHFLCAAEILDVETDNYSGPVYDMETCSSLYVAEGIVTSNCRCALLDVLIEIPGVQTNV